MSRDSAGNYTLPSSVNPVVGGTNITANWGNTTMTDLASAMTDSLDRNGRGGMLQPLKVANGSVAAPSYSFTNEPSSGFYRAGAGDIRFSLLGSDLLRLTGAGLATSLGIYSASQNGGPLAGFRNLLTNGSGIVQQRASGTLSATPQYCVDCWRTYVNSGTGVSGVIASASGVSTQSRVGVGVTAASWTAGRLTHTNRVEAANTQHLGGQDVTLTVQLYHDFGVNTDFTLTLLKANTPDNFGAVTSLGSGSASCPSGSFTKITLTVPALSVGDCANGLEFSVVGAVNTVANKNVYIGDMQLECGSISTHPEHRPYDIELSMCQRYLPGLTVSGALKSVGAGTVYSSTLGLVFLPFKVKARVEPSTLLAVPGNALTFVSGGATYDSSVIAYERASFDGATVAATLTAAVPSGAVVRSNAAARFLFTGAEL